ncbi:DUF3108 domain-containing protein [Cyclobacterium jeungdonense]|uniref:DUF3108 domain-containing protein n=1 Tax=Cyclobacterium jeungdonense TaxID=708087 RepID=A0ABT8C6A1_9BACT|nr:DUF3108 domain-containing protein [Cyclobacterium jeungdonense]MDN3688285.1 DUF3108 domain-containing protein [Cyclobacterium jeungdonense]
MVLKLQIILLTLLLLVKIQAPDPVPVRKNQAFGKGETLTFNVSYFFINAAEAKMVISDEIHRVNGKPAYKIDVYGKTLNIFKLFYVKDNWGTYIDTARIVPYRSYRHIEEGNYRKHEVIDFDQDDGTAEVKLYDRENEELVKTEIFDVPYQVQDIVSGYYLLRTMDFQGLKKGDEIRIKGFFDKKNYNLKLIYEGKDEVSTSIGDFDTHVFSPVMPSNKLFRGKKPIKMWITADENRIPVKIKASMVVGSINMDIVSAESLRNN